MDKASFWVQLHGIPIRYMTMEAAEKISFVIGDVSCPTESKDTDRGSFLHVRVSIDLSLPLCHGRLISLGNEKHTWVSFKYKRLPNLFYWCGQRQFGPINVTYDDKDCEMWIESEGTLQSDQRQFGPSSSFCPIKKECYQCPRFLLDKEANWVVYGLQWLSPSLDESECLGCIGTAERW
ncbi:hypothetical protein SO802_010804 [Lithocarpus litseifolius]|uniref:DUF4283 domain-containing protein n=1 Tax=Lithocarpus litseifolius TaxID=425828 RepID=A0AAW2DHG1_9ROSI